MLSSRPQIFSMARCVVLMSGPARAFRSGRTRLAPFGQLSARCERRPLLTEPVPHARPMPHRGAR
jgi:hypothetical protein